MFYFFYPQLGYRPTSLLHGTSSVLVTLGHLLGLENPHHHPSTLYAFHSSKLGYFLLEVSFTFSATSEHLTFIYIEVSCCPHSVSEPRFPCPLPQMPILERKVRPSLSLGSPALSCVVWHIGDE